MVVNYGEKGVLKGTHTGIICKVSPLRVECSSLTSDKRTRINMLGMRLGKQNLPKVVQNKNPSFSGLSIFYDQRLLMSLSKL